MEGDRVCGPVCTLLHHNYYRRIISVVVMHMSVLINVQRLEDENEVIKIVRQDKEEVLFYNNSDYEVCVDEGTHLVHDMLLVYHIYNQPAYTTLASKLFPGSTPQHFFGAFRRKLGKAWERCLAYYCSVCDLSLFTIHIHVLRSVSRSFGVVLFRSFIVALNYT